MCLNLVLAFQGGVSAADWLDRCMAYHDPDHLWTDFAYALELRESRPDGTIRNVAVTLDKPGDRFVYEADINGERVFRSKIGDQVQVRFNDSAEIDPDTAKKYRLSENDVGFYKNYYLFLYGIPAKLKDPGAHMQKTAEKATFMGQSAMALTITYDPEVGQDTWTFYLNPESAALIGCRFTRVPGSTKPDEYIVFEGIYELGSMRLPKKRTWYITGEDRLLGSDELVGHRQVRP